MSTHHSLPSVCKSPMGLALCGAYAVAPAFERRPWSPERACQSGQSGAGLMFSVGFCYQWSHQWEAPEAKEPGTWAGL